MSAHFIFFVSHLLASCGGHSLKAVTFFPLWLSSISNDDSFGCHFPSRKSIEKESLHYWYSTCGACLLTSLLCCLPLPSSCLLLRESPESCWSQAEPSWLPLASRALSAYSGQMLHHAWGQLEADAKLLQWLEACLSRSTSACPEQCCGLLCSVVCVSGSGPDLCPALPRGAPLMFQHVALCPAQTSWSLLFLGVWCVALFCQPSCNAP